MKSLVAFLMVLGLTAGLMNLLGSFNVTPAPGIDSPDVVMEVLDPSLRPYELMWQTEIGRRFHNVVGVMVHGGNHLEGVWDTSAISLGRWVTVNDVVAKAKERFPGRTVVLISCNPGHRKLGIPGVYYAHSNVWLVPDRNYAIHVGDDEGRLTIGTTPVKPPNIFLPMQLVFPVREKLRSEERPDVIGNIFEFIHD
jgi:hypothetical protein